MQKTVKDQNWQDQQALDRYTMIAPLLDESLDPARRSQMRQEISERRQGACLRQKHKGIYQHGRLKNST